MTQRTSQKLTNNQLVKVLRYLDDNRSFLEGMNKAMVIAYVQSGTGIAMTRGNLDGVRKIEGYEWVCPNPARKAKSSKDDDTAYMAHCLVQLFQSLGVDTPERLAEMAEAYDGE